MNNPKDLISKIKIPKGYNGTFLEGICEYAYMRTRDTLPFKTGYLSRTCFGYEIQEDEIYLYILNDECPYAYYLEYDIPKTRHFWERGTQIFTEYVNLHFKKAEHLAAQTEDLYGLKFNNNREIRKLLRELDKLDKDLYLSSI